MAFVIFIRFSKIHFTDAYHKNHLVWWQRFRGPYCCRRAHVGRYFSSKLYEDLYRRIGK